MILIHIGKGLNSVTVGLDTKFRLLTTRNSQKTAMSNDIHVAIYTTALGSD